MEYRRRRRRRQKSGSAIKAVVGIILVAGAIYLAASSEIGAWISEALITPVRSIFSPSTEAPEPETETPVSGSRTVTREVAMPTMEHYALQMGVFSSLENAEAMAEQLRAKGAAGFIIEDGSRYRVLASVYSSESDALSVRDRLRSSDTDCTLFTLQSPGIAFSVTATETQTSAIETAFAAYGEVLTQLEAAIIEFDQTQPAVNDGKEAVADIADALNAAIAPLAAESEENEVLSKVYTSAVAVAGKLLALVDSDAQTVIAFSSEMKYTHIWITNEYIQMIDRMKAK